MTLQHYDITTLRHRALTSPRHGDIEGASFLLLPGIRLRGGLLQVLSANVFQRFDELHIT